MDNIEKLLLIVLFIAILYYPLCGIVGFIEFIQGRKRGKRMIPSRYRGYRGVKTQKEINEVLDKIKNYVDHIRNTGMGKKKSLEFIEKFIEGLKTESEEI